MHVGRDKSKCKELKIHKEKMLEVEEITYLGDVVSSDARNIKNVKQRMSKGMGLIGEIFEILENLYLGPHYFQVAIMLRNTILINGMIYNMEAWHNLTPKEISDIESIDKIFLCRLLETPKSTPQEALYLELGVERIREIIKRRRISYFQDVAWFLESTKESYTDL